MLGVALFVICVGLPVVSAACFLVWLARRSDTPAWPLALAILPPLVLMPVLAWWTLQGDTVLLGVLLEVLPAVSVIALVAALVRRSRGRTTGRAAVLGLIAPLPLMAVLVLVYAYTLLATPNLLGIS